VPVVYYLVTSLEAVVLQLQDSCREARAEATELRQDNARLRHEFREREKIWRALLQATKAQQRPESDELPPPSPSFPPIHPQAGGMSAHIGSSSMNQYSSESLYRTNDDPSTALCNSHFSNGPNYANHSPSLPFAGVEHEHMSGDSSSQALGHRLPKYAAYPYPMQGPNRESPWHQSMAQSASSGGDSGAPTGTNSSSHSPGFVESPTLTSAEMSYVGRFPVEEQKVPLASLDTAPYVFPNSRSLSPTTSTPPSSSSTSLTSPFQFTFSESSLAHDRPDFDFRRHTTHTHGPEVTLHGGTADISIAGPGSDAVRFRLGARRANSGPERPLLPALPPLSESENGSQHERGSSEGEPSAYPHHRLRPRRSTVPSRSSRSPSPGAGVGGLPISGTLAVIKAQAFGALRRTRARTKKSSEGAAKVAMDVLEARGIGMGASTGSKRPRVQCDDVEIDMQT
jgi:hypothetical protein